MKNRQNDLGPFLTMVFLFLIVGFLTTANTQFQGPLREALLSGAGSLKNTFATLITFSWFLAYPFAGPVGSRWVSRLGYKGTLLGGLGVMFAGLALFTLSSWTAVRFPEALLHFGSAQVPVAFLVFLAGSFVTGASATILQVVLNPYLSAFEVRGTQSVQRLAIGGTANSVGTTIAPYFVTGVVFGGMAMEEVTVDRLTVPFGALALVIAVVGLVLARFRLPDISDTRTSGGEKLERSVWSFRHLTLGVVAIFFYVGAEVCVGGNINLYAMEKGLGSPALLATVYWGGMLVGRAVGSSLSRIPPRTQLTVTTVSAFVLVLLAVLLDAPWLLAATGLFHSIMWGAIFTLSVQGLGKYTSAASGVFMTGVVGGAVLPLCQGFLADTLCQWRHSWLLVLVAEAVMFAYARWGSRAQEVGSGRAAGSRGV